MIKATEAKTISRSAVLDPHILDQINFAIIKEASKGNYAAWIGSILMLTNIIITLKSQDLRLVFVIRVYMEFMQFGVKNKKIKNMNKLWILPTICFIIILAWSVPSYYYQKAKILELQIIVDRQSNAIQQLEREKNNIEVTIPQYLDSLPGGD